MCYVYKLTKTHDGDDDIRVTDEPPRTIFRQLFFIYNITNDPLAIYISPVSSPKPSHSRSLIISLMLGQ